VLYKQQSPDAMVLRITATGVTPREKIENDVDGEVGCLRDNSDWLCNMNCREMMK